jgi:hypothetical protein
MTSPYLQIAVLLAWDMRRVRKAWALRPKGIVKVYSMTIIVTGERPVLNAPLSGVHGR